MLFFYWHEIIYVALEKILNEIQYEEGRYADYGTIDSTELSQQHHKGKLASLIYVLHAR